MTITIPVFFFYYWLFAIVFEIFNALHSWFDFQKRYKKTEVYEVLKSMWYGVRKMASGKFLIRKLFFSPLTYIIALVFLCIISPFSLPFSLIGVTKRIIGYKSKLEKEAIAEGEKMEKEYEQDLSSVPMEGPIFEETEASKN